MATDVHVPPSMLTQLVPATTPEIASVALHEIVCVPFNRLLAVGLIEPIIGPVLSRWMMVEVEYVLLTSS